MRGSGAAAPHRGAPLHAPVNRTLLRLRLSTSLPRPIAPLIPRRPPHPLPLPRSIDLGKFRTAEAAARAHDTAKLLAGGLQAPTNFPLADAFATGLAAYKQPAPAAQQPLHHPQQPQYRGVVLRNGSWLAVLDIGACAGSGTCAVCAVLCYAAAVRPDLWPAP